MGRLHGIGALATLAAALIATALAQASYAACARGRSGLLGLLESG